MKSWFITGTSRGFGREWAVAALERGDRVAATARNLSSLEDLGGRFGDRILPIQLDVTDRAAAFAAVQQARDTFGRLDVVVNNAGYGHFGMIEEITEAEARAQIETNVFGALWVTQAVLPIMREQGSGHILQVSSIGGVIAVPNLGIYHASKWALEGFSQSLHYEGAPFGIKVTLIEPGGFSTDWGGASAIRSAPIPAYDVVRTQPNPIFRNVAPPARPGDPAATAQAVLAVVDADQPPLRLFLGTYPFDVAKDAYADRIATWEKWQEVAVAAHGG
ncbi:MAG: short-chain dehydrogenase/reductase [Stutzerimonas stutzeri]|nr:MAG: short-chain dehydrogenase/reductase [Stutzerimonas stutzeri]